jgi:hypothetical protein
VVLEIKITNQLIPSNLGTTSIIHKPPGVSSNCGNTNICPNDQISEKEPFSDQRFSTVSRRHLHYRVVCRIEAESGGRETVRDKIDPK